MNKIIKNITLPALILGALVTSAYAEPTVTTNIDPKAKTINVNAPNDFTVNVITPTDSTKPVAKTPFKATALDKLVNHNIERFSWDRFYAVNDTMIEGEKYFGHKQVLDKDTWLSSRWNQIFNNSNYKFGKDNEKIKEVVALNYKINYGVNLDTSKIQFVPDIEDSSKIKDIIYDGKIKGRKLVSSGKTATTENRHLIIPENMTIYGQKDMYNRKQEKELDIKVTEPVQPTPVTSGKGKKDNGKNKNSNKPYTNLELQLIGGYESNNRNEETIFSDISLNDDGLMLAIQGSAEGKHAYIKAGAEGNFKAGTFDDNIANLGIGTYSGKEFSGQAIIGVKIGNNIYLNPNVLGQLDLENINMNYNGAVINANTTTTEKIVGPGIGLGVRSNESNPSFEFDVHGNLLYGNKTQKDKSPIPGYAAQTSKSNEKGYLVGSKLKFGRLGLNLDYEHMTREAKSGFPLNIDQNTYRINGTIDLSKHWSAFGGFENIQQKIDQRNMEIKENNVKAGVIYKI